MKKVKYLCLLFTLAILWSCYKEGEGTVVIDSLNKNGQNFFQGQNVQVWVSAVVPNLKNAKYTWECEGGSFVGPSYMNQIVWVAPKISGEYQVSCTVESDGITDKRSTKMVVGEYFFDKFGIPSSNFTVTNLTASYTNGEVLLVGTKSNTRGNFKRLFTDTALISPFTFDAEMAWRAKYKNAASSLYWRLMFNKPVRHNGTKVKKYIREIRLEIWPTATGTTANYKLSYEEYSSEFGLSNWYTIETARKPEFIFTDGAKAADKKGMRPIAISLSANDILNVSLDRAKVLESNAIKSWNTANNISDKLCLSAVQLDVYEQTNFYLDNISLKLE